MKTQITLSRKEQKQAEISARISKKLRYYSFEQFERDAQRYLKATREGRMLCIIPHVSSSGMSRNIKFMAPEKSDRPGENGQDQYYYLNFNCFFIALGYTESRAKDGSFTISGCGMDMVFHTNYSIIHDMEGLEYITREECNVLAQKTPPVL